VYIIEKRSAVVVMAGDGEGAESSAVGERQGVPFALGGPVFVPFMVGPISTVPEFMSSALQELQVPSEPACNYSKTLTNLLSPQSFGYDSPPCFVCIQALEDELGDPGDEFDDELW